MARLYSRPRPITRSTRQIAELEAKIDQLVLDLNVDAIASLWRRRGGGVSPDFSLLRVSAVF